jgi:hypothetical protein
MSPSIRQSKRSYPLAQSHSRCFAKLLAISMHETPQMCRTADEFALGDVLPARQEPDPRGTKTDVGRNLLRRGIACFSESDLKSSTTAPRPRANAATNIVSAWRSRLTAMSQATRRLPSEAVK